MTVRRLSTLVGSLEVILKGMSEGGGDDEEEGESEDEDEDGEG